MSVRYNPVLLLFPEFPYMRCLFLSKILKVLDFHNVSMKLFPKFWFKTTACHIFLNFDFIENYNIQSFINNT